MKGFNVFPNARVCVCALCYCVLASLSHTKICFLLLLLFFASLFFYLHTNRRNIERFWLTFLFHSDAFSCTYIESTFKNKWCFRFFWLFIINVVRGRYVDACVFGFCCFVHRKWNSGSLSGAANVSKQHRFIKYMFTFSKKKTGFHFHQKRQNHYGWFFVIVESNTTQKKNGLLFFREKLKRREKIVKPIFGSICINSTQTCTVA